MEEEVCDCCGFENEDLQYFQATKDYLCPDCFEWATKKLKQLKK